MPTEEVKTRHVSKIRLYLLADVYKSNVCSRYLQGLPRSDFERREAELREVLRDIHPLPLTYPILRRYATLRRAMRPASGLIGDVDTLIAATALERELTVVTLDGDFARVPGLALMLLPRSVLQ
jgi:predicted nucleic acid-binding protein